MAGRCGARGARISTACSAVKRSNASANDAASDRRVEHPLPLRKRWRLQFVDDTGYKQGTTSSIIGCRVAGWLAESSADAGALHILSTLFGNGCAWEYIADCSQFHHLRFQAGSASDFTNAEVQTMQPDLDIHCAAARCLPAAFARP
jgi:hypothetical protein